MKLLSANALSSLGAAISLAIVSALPAYSQGYTPEQRAGWCKNEVMSAYNIPRADVSITAEQGRTVTWRINSTGRTGQCLFNNQNLFVQLQSGSAPTSNRPYRATGEIYWNAEARRWIAPDGTVCATCTPANGFPNPPATRSGFFYLPNQARWFDPDGRVCYSCTPANGFATPR